MTDMNEANHGEPVNTDLLIREALRNGEDYLRSQVDVALASDQRALGLGGILVAAASVVLSVALAGEGVPLALKSGSVLMSLGLAISGSLAFYAARPVMFNCVGNVPSGWKKDIETDRPLRDALVEELKFIDESIRDNSAIISRNAAVLKLSMALGALTVMASAAAGAFSILA